MAYPSEDNFCHKANPAAAVSYEHQSDFCLSEEHAACPVFLAQAVAPLPAALAAPKTIRARTSKTLRTPILLAVVLMIILAGAWFSRPRSAAGPDMSVPFTGLNVNRTPSLPNEPRPTHTLSSRLELGPQGTKDCPLPRGWQTYTVQPTDSIYRISIVYAVHVETLQKANCLDNQTSLKPGETFYVPVRIPTATASPTATATSTPTRTRSPFIGSSPTEDTNSDDDDEDPTATAQPRAPVVVPPVSTPTQGAQPTAQPATPTNPPATATNQPVIVPTNPPPTQVVLPTLTPPPTQVVLPTLAPPPPPTQEVLPTLPPPIQVVQPTEPSPTKEPKPTKPGKDDGGDD